jgi:AbrB family looped-hinge helix DNA binding protein
VAALPRRAYPDPTGRQGAIGMDVPARLRSDGRVTIPREVRDALAIEEGDEVVFRVEGGRVTMSRNRDFIKLAGAVDVPPDKRGTPWAEILSVTRRKRAMKRR